ncbi:F-box SKIP1-like [Olea europaea subsp. europaea]|uniref:F-box SKIP1-like n=1 Tax=Olea europaea subsp. europaea TaxID=158383 RepID=A0A8S0URZ7_OLEEU|nr:F-box SKIP1-like [Olea europaea subsp. europaea]
MEGYNQDNTADSGELARDWAGLISECLRNILSRLSLEDRWLGAMLVCKAWLQECKDPNLNSVLDLETNFDSVTELPRFWTPEFESRIDNMIISVVGWSNGSLSEIRVRHCSDRSLSLVARRCPNIRVLSIKSCPHVSDIIMSEIASGCPKLKELDISYCYQISHESLKTIGSHCPNLQILRRNIMNWLDSSPHVGIVPNEYLNAYPRDGNLEAAAIGNSMPHLLQLELQFSKLMGVGLDLICEGSLDLEYIDLSGCRSVSRRAIENAKSKLKKLEIKKPNIYITRSVLRWERHDY